MQLPMVIVLSLVVSLAQQSAKPVTPVPIMSLEAASSKGLIEFSIAGSGGSSGDVITLTVKRAVRRPLRLRLAPGTVLRSASATVQNMIVAAVKGQRIDGAKYRVADVIELPNDDERVYLLEAYCLDFDKENPGASDLFTLAAVDGSALALINSIPKFRQVRRTSGIFSKTSSSIQACSRVLATWRSGNRAAICSSLIGFSIRSRPSGSRMISTPIT